MGADLDAGAGVTRSFTDPFGRRIVIEDDGHLQTDVPICDFCLGPNPTWEYPAVDMPIKGHPFIDRTDDEWAACEECHRLLQQHSLGALVERCCRAQIVLAQTAPNVVVPPLPILRRQLRENLLRFMDARSAPARPFQ